MRIALVLAAGLVSVTLAPAASAQSASARKLLASPETPDVVASVVSALAGIVLDTNVAPIDQAANPGRPVARGETLRDVVRRDDPGFEQRLHEGARRSVAMGQRVAGAAAVQAEELKRTADRLQAALAPLAALTASN